MKKYLGGLNHLLMTVFLHNFSIFIVIPSMTDVTMSALCPGMEECSLAIYLTAFQEAKQVLGPVNHLFLTVFLYDFAVFVIVPAMSDVTMTALCPGESECSLAIYLTGIQQGITGLGTLVMMPLMGNLSDKYGRKALLTFPMTLTIIPLAILAYSRKRNYFYVYYVVKTLTSMICEGSVHCLSLAYLADCVPEGRRASAFGILSGIGSAAFVCGTLSARFLSTVSTFQVAVSVAIVATVYMRVFLEDSVMGEASLSTPILSKGKDDAGSESATCTIEENLDDGSQFFKPMPSLGDMVSLLKSSGTFSQAAGVAFFSSLADFGLYASLMYYLKARFFFNKDQFADLMVISGIAGTISQLGLMPFLAPVLGEAKLLSVALLFSCIHMFLYSVAWASWVPYIAAMLSFLSVFSQPCMRSIVSKQVGSCDQGKAQGCISGICSFAHVISPLAFSPLTALFLSERAPFHFPGFSIMCVGFAAMIAFIQSTLIRTPPPKPSCDFMVA